jgi:hypothetical protein
VVSTGDYCCKHNPLPLVPGQQFMCGYKRCSNVVATQGERCLKCKDAIGAAEHDAAPAAPPGGCNPGEVETPGAAAAADD